MEQAIISLSVKRKNMEPFITKKPEMHLVGMSFYGDPFSLRGGWDGENEIGRVWARFMKYLGEKEDLLKGIIYPDAFYEVHIYNEETIEKGVFDNPDKNEQNVISAAAFDDLKNMINKVNNCSKALGNSKINIKESELRDQTLQYGLVAKTDINKGDSLTQDNVRFAFPCIGISVEDWESIEGRPAKRNIKEDNEITLEDV